MNALLRKLFRRPAAPAPETDRLQRENDRFEAELGQHLDVDAGLAGILQRPRPTGTRRTGCWMCQPDVPWLDSCMCQACVRQYVNGGGPIPLLPNDPGETQ